MTAKASTQSAACRASGFPRMPGPQFRGFTTLIYINAAAVDPQQECRRQPTGAVPISQRENQNLCCIWRPVSRVMLDHIDRRQCRDGSRCVFLSEGPHYKYPQSFQHRRRDFRKSFKGIWVTTLVMVKEVVISLSVGGVHVASKGLNASPIVDPCWLGHPLDRWGA